MSEAKRSHESLAVLAMMVSAAIWGSGFIATRMVIDAGFSTAWILIGRFSIATILFGVIFFRELIRMTRKELLIGTMVGFLLFLGFLFQTFGMRLTTPARSAFITSIYVVIVPFMGWLIARRRPSWHLFAGAAICLIGIGLLSFSGSAQSGTLAGDGLTLLCAVSFAAHFIALEWAVHKVSIGRLLFLQMAVTTLCSLILLPLDSGQQLLPETGSTAWLTGLIALLYLALFSSGLAYAIQTTAQKYTSSAKAAIVLSAEALWGSLFSIVFRFETITLRLILGGLLIFAAILLVELPAARVDGAQTLDKAD
ncbi:MAG: DMT family transporter [Bacillota bacterium]|nr:DMT family transporter [Bacillota bacterium]